MLAEASVKTTSSRSNSEIGNSKYRKLKYISHSRKDFLSLNDKFKVRFSKNINDLNFLRYSVILRLK